MLLIFEACSLEIQSLSRALSSFLHSIGANTRRRVSVPNGRLINIEERMVMRVELL